MGTHLNTLKPMKKLFSYNVRTLIALTTVFYVVYYVLLCENCMHSSISSIIGYAKHLQIKEQHLLILAILPVYIAAMIFGAACIGIYLGSRVECLLLRKK